MIASAATAWLRDKLFSSPFNAALTVACLALLWWAVPPALDWLIFSADFVELHRHIERPALYRRHRDRIVPAMQAPRAGETRDQAWSRFMADWRAIQEGPFFPIWASATADEILSAL